MPMTETKFVNNYDDTYTVSRKCIDCGTEYSDVIAGPQLYRYRQGDHVQVAFPNMDSSLRELFFMTGICGTCWDKLFAEPDDEEEEEGTD